ncbi:biotin-dependent carboxyltransferase family protein [Porticoccaceae bacterium LTM1]|nr:biotin-dependent carboxyltransferase family protein [Porticoccaceae bacterium LTM1]
MSLTIVNPGLVSLLQDGGRFGSQHRGITTGGPLDSHAFCWANKLLDNNPNATQIEICYGNFSARFNRGVRFAITGADLNWRLDGMPLMLWRTHYAEAGSVLSAESPRSGLRSYLAVHGGFNVPQVLGSCATVMGDQLGGLADGKPLQGSDEITYDVGEPGILNRVSRHFRPDYTKPAILRVMPSNQFDKFSQQTRRQFFGQRYHLSNRADRMGCRMEGKPLSDIPGNMVSEAVALGSIQVPSDGQPIILLNDRQTIGGYPKLGNIYAVDIARLAQCQPGDEIRFELGSLEEAQYELCLFRQFFDFHPKLKAKI